MAAKIGMVLIEFGRPSRDKTIFGLTAKRLLAVAFLQLKPSPSSLLISIFRVLLDVVFLVTVDLFLTAPTGYHFEPRRLWKGE